MYLAKSRTKFLPSPWGKLSMFVQVLFVMFALGALAGLHVTPTVMALKWATVAVAIVSLADYTRRVAAAV